MKKHVVLCTLSLFLLFSTLPVLGCQAKSIKAETHHKNGLALAIDGKYEEAIIELNKAIELDPEYAAAYYDRGIAYDKGGEVAKARVDYEKCIDLSKDPELVKAAQMRLDALIK
jgi:tetratricopeptide (TPR) repeat protein